MMEKEVRFFPPLKLLKWIYVAILEYHKKPTASTYKKSPGRENYTLQGDFV